MSAVQLLQQSEVCSFGESTLFVHQRQQAQFLRERKHHVIASVLSNHHHFPKHQSDIIRSLPRQRLRQASNTALNLEGSRFYFNPLQPSSDPEKTEIWHCSILALKWANVSTLLATSPGYKILTHNISFLHTVYNVTDCVIVISLPSL